LWAISNARALRAESGCIKALRPLLPRKSGEPLCSSVAKDDHHRRTKMLSAVFAVTVKRPAMSARKVLAHVKLCGWGLPRDAVPSLTYTRSKPRRAERQFDAGCEAPDGKKCRSSRKKSESDSGCCLTAFHQSATISFPPAIRSQYPVLGSRSFRECPALAFTCCISRLFCCAQPSCGPAHRATPAT
jgi:hypothetical protein